jgi:hypothetical protein
MNGLGGQMGGWVVVLSRAARKCAESHSKRPVRMREVSGRPQSSFQDCSVYAFPQFGRSSVGRKSASVIIGPEPPCGIVHCAPGRGIVHGVGTAGESAGVRVRRRDRRRK